MIICPYCAGENPDNAIQCNHCDKFLVSKEKGGDISADYPLKKIIKGESWGQVLHYNIFSFTILLIGDQMGRSSIMIPEK